MDDLVLLMEKNWMHETLITGVLAIGVDGCIFWVKHNCVGSWNDGDVSCELQEKLLDDAFVAAGHGLVADSAFPVSGNLQGRIITPLKDGDLERSHPMARLALIVLDKEIKRL